MSLSSQTQENPFSGRSIRLQTLQQDNQSQQEAHWQKKLILQEHRAMLQERRCLLARYRQVFHNERLLLSKQHQEQGLQTSTSVGQAFERHIQQQKEAFHNYQLAIQDKLRILHEQYNVLRKTSNRAERKQAFQQLQVEWQHLRQVLREQQYHLREQQETYRQLRLDYEVQLEQLRTEKAIRRQRQEERRWQGYGGYNW
jgi:hypothetical protein